MKIDGMTLGDDLAKIPGQARDAESRGYDGWLVAETAHDPFLALGLAAEHTTDIEIGTGIAVVFPRSPMHVAQTANDLQAYSEGRFILGLGSQIKAHIEKRFSSEWSKPAARMREFILAMHAIWDCWNDGTNLDFRGDFYQHTLMTPFFTPQPNPFGRPKVALAGVGPLMTKVAGEVADVFLAHGFTTPGYFREVTIPKLEEGAKEAGRTLADIELAIPSFVVTGNSEEEWNNVDALVRGQIAFYGSTPAYRPVLEHHGWGDLQTELNTLSKQGKWAEMSALIDDEILQTFAVIGEPGEVARGIKDRYGDVAQRISLYTGYEFVDGQWEDFVRDLKS